MIRLETFDPEGTVLWISPFAVTTISSVQGQPDRCWVYMTGGSFPQALVKAEPAELAQQIERARSQASEQIQYALGMVAGQR